MIIFISTPYILIYYNRKKNDEQTNYKKLSDFEMGLVFHDIPECHARVSFESGQYNKLEEIKSRYAQGNEIEDRMGNVYKITRVGFPEKRRNYIPIYITPLPLVTKIENNHYTFNQFGNGTFKIKIDNSQIDNLNKTINHIINSKDINDLDKENLVTGLEKIANQESISNKFGNKLLILANKYAPVVAGLNFLVDILSLIT